MPSSGDDNSVSESEARRMMQEIARMAREAEARDSVQRFHHHDRESPSSSYSRESSQSRSRSNSSKRGSPESYSSRSRSRSYSSRSRSPRRGSTRSQISRGRSNRSYSSRSYISRRSRSPRSNSRQSHASQSHFSDDVESKPSDDTSETSSKDGYIVQSKGRFALCVMFLFCIGIGIGVGVGFAFAGNDDNASTNKNEQNAWLDAKDYSLFGGMEMAATTETTDRDACLEFCIKYDALQFLWVQNLCACYNSVSCLMPWGPQVDTSGVDFLGDLYAKNKPDNCTEDYCQAFESGLCFTANSQDHQDYTLYGASMAKQLNQTVETLDECLGLCAPYDAAQFLNWKDCTCYDQVDCWLEWGESVDTEDFFGMVYSKKPLNICLESYCDINQDPLCFSANVQDSEKYAVFGKNLTKTNSTLVSNEEECLELCAPFDAASFHRHVCTCYENPQCWAKWGRNVDTTPLLGTVYSKTALDFCERDYCELNTEDAICFTNNEVDYKIYSLSSLSGEDSAVEMASTQTESKQECLDFCAPFNGASFLNDKECTCFNSVDCLLPWGQRVASDNFVGTVYSKEALVECPRYYCQGIENKAAVAKDGLCFTGNCRPYSKFSLFANSLRELASTDDVNTEMECLIFCKEYPAAQYLPLVATKCKCFTQAECWLPWSGDHTVTLSDEGSVFSKEEIGMCKVDYCSQNPNSGLCTATARSNGE